MLKTEEDSYSAYHAESVIEPFHPGTVFLKDRRLKKYIGCYGSPIRPHAPSTLLEELGWFGSFDFPTIYVVKCNQCSLVYHVPRDVVEVVPFFAFF